MNIHSLKLVLMATVIALCGCTSETYDSGDGYYSYMQADMCEANTSSDSQLQSILTDDGTTWQLSKAATADWVNRPDTTYRALVYYNNVSQSGNTALMEIVNIAQVPVIGVMERAKLLKMKTDPVEVVSLWKSGTGKYINVRLNVKTGSVDDDAKGQTLALRKDSTTTAEDGKTCSHLTLYHDQGDVPEYYSQSVLFSLPVSRIDADSVRLYIQTESELYQRQFSVK